MKLSSDIVRLSVLENRRSWADLIDVFNTLKSCEEIVRLKMWSFYPTFMTFVHLSTPTTRIVKRDIYEIVLELETDLELIIARSRLARTVSRSFAE